MVIGSECDAFDELKFIGDRARALFDTLVELGEWEPAGGASGPLVNPTVLSFKDAVRAAFTEASNRQASLLFAFIGHGQSDGDQDYYLFAKDSTQTPDSDSAFLVSQRIREHLKQIDLEQEHLKTATGLDGLVCLIDACEAAEAAQAAGARWLQPLVAVGGRMELMVASADGKAYDGCFTRTLVATAQIGKRNASEFLLCADLKPAIVEQCTAQTPILMSFDGVTVVHNDSTDRGLYLVANKVRCDGPLSGTAAAVVIDGVIDQLTRGVVITGTVAEAYQRLHETDSHRLRAVIGAPGAGKSTLVSLLLRPQVVADAAPTLPMHGVVFLEAASTRQSIAETLATQLHASIPTFQAATARVEAATPEDELKTLDALERRVLRPLEHCRAQGMRVRVLLDGLDQPDTHARADVIAVAAALADPIRSGLNQVRVIVTARDTLPLGDYPGMDAAFAIPLDPPSSQDLATYIEDTRGRRDLAIDNSLLANLPADGGWLIARLLSEIEDRFLPYTTTWSISAP